MMKQFAVLALVFFLMWPFHRRHAPAPQDLSVQQAATPAGDVWVNGVLEHVGDTRCDAEAGTFFFLGPDGMIGTSTVSCDAAYQSWRYTVAPHQRWVRI